ncbi:hypothetical protein V2J09_020445 [Rumex salicifolius]
MPEKKFLVERSKGKNNKKSSFDRGNESLLGGRYREKTPCNSPTKMDFCSGFEGDYRDKSNDMGETSTCGMSFMKGHMRGRNSIKSRRSHLHHLKPLSSLESCLMAQLYKEHAETEHLLAPLPSPCTPALRPFLVSDGAQIFSRSSCESFDVQSRDGKGKSQIKIHTEVNETVSGGILHLPEIRSDEGSKENKLNLKRRKDQNRNFSNTRRMQNELQISAQANKAEVAKLHDLLKQTENLVQDLHEEIEMKDSLVVKELVNEDDTKSYANENSADRLKRTDSPKAIDSPKAAETIESISTIEAELEAELERMELNMKKSTLNGRLSDDDDDELDPELMAEVVQGEFRADILCNNKSSSELSVDHSSRSSHSTPQTPKQGVSPRDLSIRLHKVIQSRLEQRIMELEAALEESDKRVLQLQSEQQLSSCSWRGFSQTDMSVSSFSTRDSPSTIGGSSTPVDPYNVAGSNTEKLNGTENVSFLIRPASAEPKTPMTSSGVTEQSETFCLDEDEEEDEDLSLLIRQIVEKTRQGSPAVLQAQKAMAIEFSNPQMHSQLG